MLTLFNLLLAKFYRLLSNVLAPLGSDFRAAQMGRLATQVVVVSMLAVAL